MIRISRTFARRLANGRATKRDLEGLENEFAQRGERGGVLLCRRGDAAAQDHLFMHPMITVADLLEMADVKVRA